jgi:cyclopropane-fatty-acyl-phospholipid synthase
MSHLLATSQSAPAPFGVLDRLARRVVVKQLAGLHDGQITLSDASGIISLGEAADLEATLLVNRPRFFRQAVLGGTLSVAESYLRGDWDCEDLTSLFRIFVRNSDSAERLDSGLAKLANGMHRL